MDEEKIEILSQKYVLEMLQALSEEKSTQQLAEEHNIPIATVYRRIADLEEAGLVETSERLTDGRQWETIYKRAIADFTVDLTGSEVTYTETEPRETPPTPPKAYQRA